MTSTAHELADRLNAADLKGTDVARVAIRAAGGVPVAPDAPAPLTFDMRDGSRILLDQDGSRRYWRGYSAQELADY